MVLGPYIYFVLDLDSLVAPLELKVLGSHSSHCRASMPLPQTLQTNPKCIFFSDFDGTITLNDSEFSRAPTTVELG